MSETHSKVRAAHLERDAYLYVRQSTIRQVFENTESTKRQYALRQRAVALGWPIERVYVIDSDLGQSGASAADREGFKRLITEVSLGRVGIVLGLEVSRLARNNKDWHQQFPLGVKGQMISAIQGAIKSEGDWQRANREVNVTKCSSVHPIAKPCRTLPRNRHPLAPPVLSRLPRDDSSHFFREGRSQAIMSCLR